MIVSPNDESRIMEAEQINQIANTLDGLKDRTAQLRRYL
jgi:hypothetical protein